jgi:hypothetical protein
VFLFDIIMNATTLDSNTGRIKRITRLVEVLPVKFQDEIERQLERLVMTVEAQQLSKGVGDNTITIQEIIEEIRNIRSDR